MSDYNKCTNKNKKRINWTKNTTKSLKKKKEKSQINEKKYNSESECTKSKNHVKYKIIVKRLNCLARKLIYLESPF